MFRKSGVRTAVILLYCMGILQLNASNEPHYSLEQFEFDLYHTISDVNYFFATKPKEIEDINFAAMTLDEFIQDNKDFFESISNSGDLYQDVQDKINRAILLFSSEGFRKKDICLFFEGLQVNTLKSVYQFARVMYARVNDLTLEQFDYMMARCEPILRLVTEKNIIIDWSKEKNRTTHPLLSRYLPINPNNITRYYRDYELKRRLALFGQNLEEFKNEFEKIFLNKQIPEDKVLREGFGQLLIESSIVLEQYGRMMQYFQLTGHLNFDDQSIENFNLFFNCNNYRSWTIAFKSIMKMYQDLIKNARKFLNKGIVENPHSLFISDAQKRLLIFAKELQDSQVIPDFDQRESELFEKNIQELIRRTDDFQKKSYAYQGQQNIKRGINIRRLRR